MIKITSYNHTYNHLTIISETRRYIYEGVSPHLYRKLNYMIKKGWYGAVWQKLQNLKLVSRTSNYPN